eukprot:251688_1
MMNTNMNTNTIQQTSLSNSSPITIPSPTIKINDESHSKQIETPLLNEPTNEIPKLDKVMNIGKDSHTDLDNNISLTEFNDDLDISELNLSEIYTQYHCMDYESVQLTSKKYEETIIDNINCTPVINNILKDFFTKSSKSTD